ncbi:hypothetical protein [Niastella sp. OAS944]|uniref:hypothetical protein n=1 Tax=Niastella sp. OAS944 TaxID=2664089 RepID=UPI00348BE108|nr:hypothetical protein [Chitinophagaceae bacterium OAS944]
MKKCLLFLWLAPLCLHAQMQMNSYNPGTSFTCIAVDSNYNIWAGRSNGVYQLNKSANATTFTALAGTSNFNVQALAADHWGYIWAGHNGRGGSTAAGGGIEQIPINNPAGLTHYSPDRNAQCFTYLARNGIATLNCAGLAVDSNGSVWSAHKYHDLTSSPDYIVTPGTFSFNNMATLGFVSRGTWQDYINGAEPGELPYPAYTCNPTVSQTPQTRNVYCVAAGKNEAWISVGPYTSKSGISFPARVLKYNLDATYTGVSADFATLGIPAGGIFNGLWLTATGDLWVTMSAGKGFAVRRKGNWTYVNTANLSCIFPAGASINANAIWGNRLGQVFIGTNKGLIVYHGSGSVNSKSSYTFYTAATHGLISDNILGGVSEKDSIQWIATSNGIMSSTLGRNYPLIKDTADYHVCNLHAINDIEAQSEQDVTGRKDYHIYHVETEVCTTTGPNGGNCNAEYVYKLMKGNVSLTAPTPFDFPYDVLGVVMLKAANKNTVADMVYRHVSAFDPATMETNSNGGIKYISQVLDGTYLALHNTAPSNKKVPWLSDRVDKDFRAFWMLKQKADNPDSVVACHTYNLYNSQLFINDRVLYDRTLDNWVCGNQLRDTRYDQVWIYPNDKDLTFTNYTQPGHFLSPGKVFRSVVEECGKVKIVTVGTGLSYCGSVGTGENNAIGNIIVGSILFKNIDLRLKKTFEAGH